MDVEGARAGRTNTALEAILAEAGWTPRALARAINAAFGPGTVAETAPYYWLSAGSLPRGSVPTMAAAVLSQVLGRMVAATSIWPGYSGPSDALVLLADEGLDGPWTAGAGTKTAIAWLTSGELDRRTILTVAGAPLLRALWGWLATESQLPAAATGLASSHPLIDHVEASIPLLQRLDDAHGGASHLAYVHMQLASVAQVLRDGRQARPIKARLLAAVGEMGQLAGWMAHDSQRHGLAQRHWFTALRAAHRIGDRPLAAHILADIAVQTSRTDSEQAIVIAEAATRVAERSPATVRASVASRQAYCYAAAGRRAEFGHAYASARTLLDRRNDAVEPAFMYYLTDAHLDCQAGYAMVAMGRRQLRLGDRGGRTILVDGHELLRRGAYDAANDSPSARRALYEGAWLALGHVALGDMEQAFMLADRAASRLSEVRSPRSSALLAQTATDLRARTKNVAVRDYLPQLERTLTTAGTVIR